MAALLLAALATLPPELLAQWRGWEWVDPAYLGLSAAWWPVELACRLALLRHMVPAASSTGLGPAWGRALAMELLFSLRLAVVGLAGLVPAAALLSIVGVEAPTARLGVIALAILGLAPTLAYFFARSLAPLFLLSQPLSPGASLNASAGLVRGRWRPFLRALLPLTLAAWALEGLGQVLPEASALLLSPVALWLELKALAGAWQALQARKNP